MTDPIGVFVTGLVLGIGAAAPIGPVNVQIARLALRGSFGAAVALGMGAVTVDVFYAVVTGVGVASLPQQAIIEGVLRVSGGLLLAYLGFSCFGSEREAWRADPVAGAAAPVPGAESGAGARGRAYVTGLLMTLFNPMTLAFWFVAVPVLTDPASDRGNELPLICIGVFAATVGWVLSFAGLLALGGKYRRRWWLAAADAGGGAVLLVFAAAALLCSLRPFL